MFEVFLNKNCHKTLPGFEGIPFVLCFGKLERVKSNISLYRNVGCVILAVFVCAEVFGSKDACLYHHSCLFGLFVDAVGKINRPDLYFLTLSYKLLSRWCLTAQPSLSLTGHGLLFCEKRLPLLARRIESMHDAKRH